MIEPEEQKKLEAKYRQLLDDLYSHTTEQEIEKVKDAYRFLESHCGEKRRKDNELYILHPLEVAHLLVDQIGLGATSVIAALLHNVPYVCEVSVDKIGKRFGSTVASIIRDFKKISDIYVEKPSLYSENFRNLLLSLAGDIRVILLKLADRVHIMRTLEGVDKKTRERAAEETSFLYAPLAHRLGLYNLKTELEENAMYSMYPEIYNDISRKLRETKEARAKYIREFTQPIETALRQYGFDFEIKGRSKSIHSIWQKMKNQNVPFERVYDVFAIRIILNNIIEDEKTDCWRVYSFITNEYEPNPTRLRDWVSTPKKATGYESLHTTVKGPRNRWVEVQIRTRRMDENAEKGQAAHWKYKEGESQDSNEERLKSIREMLEQVDPNELDRKEHAKIDLYKDTIFVFTPQNDLKKLSTGATVLDFAYQIHSKVGDKCMGAIVNGKNVPIRHELQNGDQVKILTANNQKPSPDWVNFVKSNRTKNKIRRALRRIQYKDVDEGKAILQRKLSQQKMEFNDRIVKDLIQHYKLNSAQDLYQGIGSREIDISDLKKILAADNEPAQKPVRETAQEIKTDKAPPKKKPSGKADKTSLLIDGERINDYHMANCCKPVFGDDIFGFVTVDQGIKIHRTNCPNAKQLKEKYGYRIIDAKWYNPDEEASYLSELRITGKDELGVVNNISEVISNDLKVNMQSVSFSSNKGTFVGHIKVFVTDTKYLDALFHKLLKVKGVDKVTRIG
ncbi:MAG: RelA/SpoT family protein [Bacteroidales bacterium]|nr:RelA/SpoT family protein [Bacteroidales bacterium]MCF8333215.1 RelA/SpoT family protein [Bacteroidales bacterium]